MQRSAARSIAWLDLSVTLVGLLAAADAGANPRGGLARDDEVIAAADDRDMAMIFTGARHFRY